VKACTRCGVERPLTEFYKRKETKDGRTSHCKQCRNEYRNTRPRSKNYRETNRQSYYRNPGPYREAKARRRAAKLQRIPKWREAEWDDFVFSEAYSLAKLRTQITGVPHEIDHVIPLQGDLVSGLHIAENIQVITRLENRQKGNRYEV